MTLAARHGTWLLLAACTSVRPAPDASVTGDRPGAVVNARDEDAATAPDVAVDWPFPEARVDAAAEHPDASIAMDALDARSSDDHPDVPEGVDVDAFDTGLTIVDADVDAAPVFESSDASCDPWSPDASAWGSRDVTTRDAACTAPPLDAETRRGTLPDGGLCPAWNPFCTDTDLFCTPNGWDPQWTCGGCLSHCFDDPFSTARCNEDIGRCERVCRDRTMDCDCDPTTACDTNVISDRRNCGACGHACEPGETCVGGRCRTPGIRPLAPISALRVGARPWFRWRLPGCADGARVEVCASRSCASIEHTWDVRGTRLRPTAPLRDGVHFWRVTARVGDALVGATSDVWEFAVGPVPAGAPSRHALLDADGDGVEEEPSSVTFSGNRSWMQVYIGDRHGMTYTPTGPFALGDVDGDGFGDVGFIEYSFDHRPRGFVSSGVRLFVRLGGAHGLRTVPLTTPLTSVPDSEAIETLRPAGDRNGDGFGDLWWQNVRGWCNPVCDGGGVMGGNGTLRRTREPTDLETWSASGDFDADGLADLVFTRRFSVDYPNYSRTYTLVPGVPDGAMPRQRVVGCRAAPTPTLWRGDDTHWVADHNDDGYDDLIATEGPGTPLLVFFGGPDGLVETRCMHVAR